MKKVEKTKQHNSRIVVITGTSSGIGKECKLLFESKNDIVVCLSRHNEDNFENFYKCDVSDENQVREVFEKIKEKFKKIDILINNAGFGISGATELIEDSEIQRIFDVNLFGVINCYKNALPLMDRNSKILNISSACALFPLPYRSLYCSSKSAVQMLSLSTNMECKPLGIEVVSICPGDIKTNFTKNRVKIYKTNDRYKNRITNAAESIDTRENKRMPVSYVANKLYKISLRRKNKPFIIIGAKYKFLYFAMRFLPASALLFFTEKFFGGHKNSKEKEKNNGR